MVNCIQSETLSVHPRLQWTALPLHSKWTQEHTGPLSYKVELENGSVVRWHVDNIRERSPSHSLEAQTGPQLDTEVAPDTVDPLIFPDLPATPAVQLVPPTVDNRTHRPHILHLQRYAGGHVYTKSRQSPPDHTTSPTTSVNIDRLKAGMGECGKLLCTMYYVLIGTGSAT